MGTPMAVNCANVFMMNFEEKILGAFKSQHIPELELWLRFIDDVLFILEGYARKFG